MLFAVLELAGRGQVSIGAELSVAVGPVGRTGAGNVSVAAEGVAHAYSCKLRRFSVPAYDAV